MIHHYLDLIVDGYAGNFEQELVSYVFNSVDYDQERRSYVQHLTEEEREETNRVLNQSDEGGFLDFMTHDEYGLVHCDLSRVIDPATGVIHDAVRVQVTDETWQAVDVDALYGLVRRRAQAFFTLYLRKLPSYQAQEGAFRGLAHTVVVTEERIEFV